MKKFLFLVVLVISTMFTFTSCEPDEPEMDNTQKITITNLVIVKDCFFWACDDGLSINLTGYRDSTQYDITLHASPYNRGKYEIKNTPEFSQEDKTNNKIACTIIKDEEALYITKGECTISENKIEISFTDSNEVPYKLTYEGTITEQ